jgi:hypothetical protein
MLRPGDRIGPYRLERILGQGGFATVFLAEDERLRASVAVKVLADNHAASPAIRERFFDEGHLLRRVASTAMVTVHDVGEQEGQPYLVLEYADRGDLGSRVAAATAEPTVDDVRFLVRHLGAALADLEAAEVVHRDIKPSNVLVASRTVSGTDRPGDLKLFAPDDRLLLGDLGLAKDLAAGSGLTAGAGTGSFAAPEQGRAMATVTSAADIYGATATLRWFVGGSVPGDRTQQPQRDQSSVRPLLVGLEGVIDRGLADDPLDRHPSAGAWTDAALGALGSLDGAAPNLGNEEAGSRRLALPLLAAVVLIAVASTGYLLVVDRPDNDVGVAVGSPEQNPADASQRSMLDGVNLASGPTALQPEAQTTVAIDTVLTDLDRQDLAVSFRPGQVTPIDGGQVDTLAQVIAGTGVLIQLVGFDDGDGQPSLGDERARAVRQDLIERHGLPPDLLVTVGVTAEADRDGGVVAASVGDAEGGGLLLSSWQSQEPLWSDPSNQVITPGLRAVGVCDAPCLIQVEGLLTAVDTGVHFFDIITETEAELWISPSADPAGLEPVVLAPIDGDDPAASVTLESGQPVYVRLRGVSDPSSGPIVVWREPRGDTMTWVSPIVLSPPQLG